MPLERGTRLGPYQMHRQSVNRELAAGGRAVPEAKKNAEITGQTIVFILGAGGMGEVYKATDTRLERTVAIKVLPAHVASDPERKSRFEREAKTVAALSHPHICPVFDVGREGETDFLVMEYLEGETLADRLSKGALPLDQALRYAIEIADALDKAHRQGVTHRDLKPANIMLTKAGAKLLDFGLAKLKPTGPQSDASTRLDDALTEQGTILGTFQYMAPEQLEGQDADARSDIWAFGCVVYEMVTGVKTFEGKTQASLIGAILKDEPRTISTLQPMSPPALDQLIRICLAKDPDERWQSAGDIGRQLKLATDGSVTRETVVGSLAGQERSRGRQPVKLAAAVLIASLVTGFAVWGLTRPSPAAQRLARFTLSAPELAPVKQSGQDRVIAISPDGSRLAYVADGNRLYLRSLDQLDAFPLRGVTQALNPFFSPDGDWVGYYDPTDRTLKKVLVAGGPPVTLAQVDGLRGASWGLDDTIVFSEQTPGGLSRISSAGGDPEILTESEGDSFHEWPEFLPDAQGVLFSIQGGQDVVADRELAVLRLATGNWTSLGLAGDDPHYSPTGHIVYGYFGTLRSAPFDIDRLTVTGDPVPVLDGVRTRASGAANFDSASDGSLVYVAGAGGATGPQERFVWLNRDDTETVLPIPSRPYGGFRLSPDRTRMAVNATDEEDDIWIWSFERETLTRLTFTSAPESQPIWTPDGRRVVFTRSGGGGRSNIYWRPADGTGTVERLTESPNVQVPTTISPDGTRLVFQERLPGVSNSDLHVLTLDDERQVQPLIVTEFNETNAEISLDGQWLAYQSSASGRDEIYVQPFPDVEAGRWQISTAGGAVPRWGPDGRELFYLTPTPPTALMTVLIDTSLSFMPGTPTAVFTGGFGQSLYDISSDGQQFLRRRRGRGTNELAARPQIVLVQNWFTELERLVPTP